MADTAPVRVIAAAALAPVLLAWVWPGCGGGTTAATATATAAMPAGPPDADGDGYADGEDCDDGDASVNPGAAELTCDGKDNDCAGGDDRGDCALSRDEAVVIPLDDVPYFSGLEADLDGRPGDDLVVSSATAAQGLVVSGLGTDEVRTVALNGVPARSAGDVDGDGAADLWVSDASGYSYYLLRGPFTRDMDPATDFAAVLGGARGGLWWYGRGDSDLDGDGQLDLMDPAGVVCLGPFSGVKSQYDACSFYARDLRGQGGANPYSSAIGDVTGDGLAEIGVVSNGEVWVLAGDPRSWGPAADEQVEHLTGEVSEAITSVSFPGDLDGDGYDDVGVTVDAPATGTNPIEVGSGALTLMAGPLAGGGRTTLVDGAGFATVTPVREVSPLGDVDRDGAPELSVSDADHVPGILRVPTSGEWAYGDVVVAGEPGWRPSDSARVGADANADGEVDFAAFDVTEGQRGALLFTALAELR